MTTNGYGYMNTTKDQYYSDGPQQDMFLLYQTPKDALVHPAYIRGVISSTIGALVINWVIGALTMIGKDRSFLWSSFEPYIWELHEINPSNTIWIELLITIALTVLMGSPIKYLLAKAKIKKGEYVLIRGQELAKFRLLGVTLTTWWARTLIWTIFSTMTVFPSILLTLHLTCNYGGMSKIPVPPEFLEPGECYMPKEYYILLRGVACGLAGLVVSWIMEWGTLNVDNLPDDVVRVYKALKGHIEDDSHDEQQVELSAL
jgi:hypothetical protein